MSNEELVESYQKGNKKALERLIEQNTRIVYKIAGKYKYVNRRYDKNDKEIPEDLIQEGYIGIMIAAKKYDINNPKKAKFITYVVYWINRKIYNYVNGDSEKDKANNEMFNNSTSLNTPIGLDDDGELQDTIEGIDYGYENIEEQIYLEQLRKDLECAMKEYTSLKEREVLQYKYGWYGSRMTLEELAELYNVSSNEIRNTEEKGLRRLRNSKWARLNRKYYSINGYIDPGENKISNYMCY